jgi:hypothetical protein
MTKLEKKERRDKKELILLLCEKIVDVEIPDIEMFAHRIRSYIQVMNYKSKKTYILGDDIERLITEEFVRILLSYNTGIKVQLHKLFKIASKEKEYDKEVKKFLECLIYDHDLFHVSTM